MTKDIPIQNPKRKPNINFDFNSQYYGCMKLVEAIILLILDHISISKKWSTRANSLLLLEKKEIS